MVMAFNFDSLRIGGIDYKLLLNSRPDETSFGYMNDGAETIFIASGFSKARQDKTLAHEILHSLIAESGSSSFFGEGEEENFVLSMEHIFELFLKDYSTIFQEGN